MTYWMYCPQCNQLVDELKVIVSPHSDCPSCGLKDIWSLQHTFLDDDIVDFMTTGIIPNMPPRSDQG